MVFLSLWRRSASVASASLLLFSLFHGFGTMTTQIASAATCTPVSQAGLLGYWKFDETSGTTTADSTGLGHTGTLRNNPIRSTDVPTQVTPNVRSLQFPGTNQDVQVANSADFNFGLTNFTVTAFARASTGDRSVLGNFSAGHRGWGMYFYNTNRVNFFGYGNLGSNDTSQAAPTILNNQWHHVAGVYTRTGPLLTIDTYVDGTLIGTNSANVGDITANSDLLFGHYLGQPFYSGKLDDIRVYGRALTAQEVSNLSNGCGNLPMCNGMDATIYVSNGTVVGGPDNGKPYNGNLRGTSGDDVIVGPPDQPVNVDGGGGNDTVCTGSKGDNIVTYEGRDWIDAGDGGNNVDAGNGNNTVKTGNGSDIVSTGSGNDSINAGDGSNAVNSDEGDDSITTGNGADSISSGDGSDTINAGNGMNVINAGGGDDSVTAGSGNDTANGGPGTDTCNLDGGSNNATNCEAP